VLKCAQVICNLYIPDSFNRVTIQGIHCDDRSIFDLPGNAKAKGLF